MRLGGGEESRRVMMLRIGGVVGGRVAEDRERESERGRSAPSTTLLSSSGKWESCEWVGVPGDA